jgi:hypothetical protein
LSSTKRTVRNGTPADDVGRIITVALEVMTVDEQDRRNAGG